MSCRFGIEEVDRDVDHNEDGHEDEIVLPRDSLESNGVDENIEEERKVARELCKSEATSTKVVWPDFGGVGIIERRAIMLVSFCARFIEQKVTGSMGTLTKRCRKSHNTRKGMG